MTEHSNTDARIGSASGAALRALLLATCATVAGLAFTSLPVAAQQGQSQPPSQAGNTAAATQGGAAQQLAAAEQSLRQAISQMQNASGAQVGGAVQSARQALTQLQQAMAAAPAERRNSEAWRNLEREMNQANAALQGDRPDLARARTELDQVILLIPTYRSEMGMAAAGGTSGANIVIREQAAQVQVQQAQPQVTVTQPEPVVTVIVPQPEIIVRQPAPQVTVQMPPPQVAVEQPRPDVRVVEAQPQIQVQPGQPQVQVQQAQPRIIVQQQGQPQLRFEQQGEAVVNLQREGQAAANTGAPAPAVAPAQSGGAEVQRAAAGTAGLPLARVQSIVGTNVVGANGRDAGEVENLLIDRQGNVRAAVIEWGGFLGIGENRAVVPIDQLRFGGAGERVRMELTREQLERLPRYERNSLGDYANRFGWGEGVRLYR